MKVNCLTCDKEFDKANSEIKASPNHFCSRSCSAIYNNRKNPKRRPEGKCKQCGQIINTSKRYCSEKCKSIAADIKRLPEELQRNNRVQAVVQWRQRTKLKAIAHKGGSCQKCGYCKSVAALHFHHTDPNQKDFNIGGNTRSWDRIRTEIDKCILLCANCHTEEHERLSL